MGDAGRDTHLVELSQVRKSFGDNLVLDGIDLRIDRGEAIVVAGPSGSGSRAAYWCEARSTPWPRRS